MASNVRIGHLDLAKAATITASSELATLPASRLQTPVVADIWRSTSGTAYLIVDFGASVTLGYVGFHGHNLGSGGGADTWRVRFSTADATGATGDAYTEAANTTGLFADTRTAAQRYEAEPFGRAHRFFTAVAGRYLRLDFAMAALAYVQGGRLVAMNLWEPSRAFRFGATWDPAHGTRRLQSKGGQVYVDQGFFQRRLQFSLSGLSQTEAFANAEQIDRLNGLHDDVLVCLNYASTNLDSVTLWGLIENRSPMAWANLPMFQREFIVGERK